MSYAITNPFNDRNDYQCTDCLTRKQGKKAKHASSRGCRMLGLDIISDTGVCLATATVLRRSFGDCVS